MTKLSTSSLPDLRSPVRVPTYDRSTVRGGILHFGVGNFHRAHQAAYIDDLLEHGSDMRWGIVGAGVLPGERPGWQKLRDQDWLTTVVEQDVEHIDARVTGAMVDFLAPGDAAAIVERLCDPSIAIVSLTITEGGYFRDASGAFAADHPAVLGDAARPESPATVFGIMLAGLRRRRSAGIAPFTVVSCDNIPHNGHVTASALKGLAGVRDPDLAAWIEDNVACPNGMVDRITPRTSDEQVLLLRERFGIEDNWPVFCEPFRQWVLEDHFPLGRPALEEVGVEFVADVAPYESMKIRILNGGHAALAYPAALLGHRFVHDAMGDPLIRSFLDKLEREEIIPTVGLIPGTDMSAYFRSVARRFGNPAIADTIQRLCFDGSNRQPKFILPVARDRLRATGRARGLALVSALWCRYCQGSMETGGRVEANDPQWDRLRETADAARARPGAWLDMSDIYGDLGQSEAFAADFREELRHIWDHGTASALSRFASAGD